MHHANEPGSTAAPNASAAPSAPDIPTAPGGVVYRRAPYGRIILAQCSSAMSMTFYTLITLISYAANVNYGVAMGVAGVILTGARVFDGIVNPAIALVMDRINPRHGKIRLFMCVGWLISALAVLALYTWSAQGGAVLFALVYALYIVGNATTDIACNMAPNIITNDPRQRPMVGVIGTIFAYLVPIVLTLVITLGILPRFGNEYTSSMLATCALAYLPLSFVFLVLSMVGVSKVDTAENYRRVAGSAEPVDVHDMMGLLRGNRPFQMYLLSCVSSKLSQQTMSQAIVSTVVFGILMGSVQFGSIMSAVTSLPALFFAFVAGRLCGRLGSREVSRGAMRVAIVATAAAIGFCLALNMRDIPRDPVLTTAFFVLMVVISAMRMCMTTADGAMRADVIDYELSRSGKYLPGVVAATYNFIDRLISSLATTIASLAVGLAGYVATAPQPTDAPTPELKVIGLALYFGMPIASWLIGLAAMKRYSLTRERMVEVQRENAGHREQREA